jgi:fucose permease
VNHRNRLFFVLASGFILLGMAVTVPGVTWPSVAESFDRSLAELGYVTLLFGGGYTVSSLVSGRLTARRGIGPLLIAAAITGMVALAAIALSGTWLMFLVATCLIGVGGGLTDAATNTYVAIRRGARAMGLIHGVFGIGAIAGPLLVTVLLQTGISWRVAYALLALGQGLYIAGLWHFARSLDTHSDTGRGNGRTGLLRSPILTWSLIVFFAYAGIGAGAGAWAFTYLTAERGMSDGVGGLIVAGYWGGFTASRLLLGALGERFRPNTVLRWSVVSTTVAFAVLWWSQADWLGAAALIFAGFAHGPVFPLEILLTPRRFGAALTATVVGFEIAAANIGGALIPGLMGVAVGFTDLAVLPPILVANSLVLLAAIEMLRRQTSKSSRTHIVQPDQYPDQILP